RHPPQECPCAFIARLWHPLLLGSTAGQAANGDRAGNNTEAAAGASSQARSIVHLHTQRVVPYAACIAGLVGPGRRPQNRNEFHLVKWRSRSAEECKKGVSFRR